ncbi:MAG: hypothetical protein WD750_05875 [Gammaproteobacteria bacterium]
MSLTNTQIELLRVVGDGNYFYPVHADEVAELKELQRQGYVIVRDNPHPPPGTEDMPPIAFARLTQQGRYAAAGSAS